MSIRTFTRNRGWRRLCIVFACLWHGAYLLIAGIGFVVNDWEFKVTDQFWPMFFLWNAIPWILVLFLLLIRFIIEGFANDNK